MPDRTNHEMDEWERLRRPWYVTFWRWFFIIAVVSVALFFIGSWWRIAEFAGSKTVDCEGVVRKITVEQVVSTAGSGTITRADVQVRGRIIEIVVDKERYPYIKEGDTVDLTCRVGRSGSLFVQQWRPRNR